MRRLVALAFVAVAPSALAADLPAPPPTFATDPNAAVAPDYWKGFYVGAGVSGSFAKGAKGVFGGYGYAGYEKTFDDNLKLGLQVDAGYQPWASPHGRAQGFNFTEADVKVGYQMGQITPYVFTGVAFDKATRFAGDALNPGQSVNAVFNDPGALRASGVFGVGVDYQVTDKLKIGVSAYVHQGGASFPP